jgi:hypothetical protein
MGDPHGVSPDLSWNGAARGSAHRAEIVVSNPDAGGEVGRVTDEPGVTPIGTGAGLAGDVAVA